MRRSILILLPIITVFQINEIYSQENHLGVKGGISLPKLSGGGDNELSRDYQSRIAPNAGVFVDLGVTRNLSIQTELNFAGNGGKRRGIRPPKEICVKSNGVNKPLCKKKSLKSRMQKSD